MEIINYRSISENLSPFIHRTPVLTSSYLNTLSGVNLYFKCEQFQKMGAFKMRGAVHALLQLSDAEKKSGVCTHSSGNHGQALALAGRNLQISVTVIVPKNAPAVKLEAMVNYGANIVLCEPTIAAREAAVQEFQNKTGAIFIHPSNDRNVIIGQGTAAWELMNDYLDIDQLVTPVGGGGLLAGTILAAQSIDRKVSVFAGEPEGADDAFRSILSGKIEMNDHPHTIADGLRTHLGDQNFPIILNGIEKIFKVSENEITSAMRLIWERLKVVTEPSSAVALAAILKHREQFAGKDVGVILTGGNVDLANLPF